jgi:hypothetical protein
MARLLVPYTGPPITDGVEHYPGCGCPRCATIRADRWASLNLIDRLQESLNAKIEGDNGHLPIRGMMNLADVQALITQVRSQT